MTVREQVGEIYEAERESIYSYLLHFGVPAQRAQELAQDAFLKLYLKMSQGEQLENPRAWLFRVAHNAAVRSFTREARFDQLDTDLPLAMSDADPERSLMDRERRSLLVRAVQKLSPQQRHVLHLRTRGLRYREIADVIGISTSAVGEFLRRAVAHLKEALDG